MLDLTAGEAVVYFCADGDLSQAPLLSINYDPARDRCCQCDHHLAYV